MKTITIVSKTHGTHEVLVDDEDFDRVNQFKWFIHKRCNTLFYARTTICKENGIKTCMYLHRFILNETNPKVFIDHIKHNGLDCRKSKMRLSSHQNNMRNRRPRKNVTSSFLGVYFDKQRGKWRGESSVNGKNIFLGRFDNEVDAAKAYNDFAINNYGEFASLNTI